MFTPYNALTANYVAATALIAPSHEPRAFARAQKKTLPARAKVSLATLRLPAGPQRHCSLPPWLLPFGGQRRFTDQGKPYC